MPNGGIVAVALLWPNLLWVLMPPRSVPDVDPGTAGPATRLLSAVEGVGRIGVFVVPWFYSVHGSSSVERWSVGVMAAALTLYYAGWARYFLKGRDCADLYRSMIGIPTPLAVAPVVYLVAAAFVLHSPILAIAAVAFGVAHITLSCRKIGASSPAPAAEEEIP